MAVSFRSARNICELLLNRHNCLKHLAMKNCGKIPEVDFIFYAPLLFHSHSQARRPRTALSAEMACPEATRINSVMEKNIEWEKQLSARLETFFF
jgi:hypothetical protein